MASSSSRINLAVAVVLVISLVGSPLRGEEQSEDDLEEELSDLKEDDFPDLVPAGEKSELTDELSTLEDDDFPDLVSAADMGELGDELLFLQDDSMVELAARHRQKIGMSPSAVWVITREEIDTAGANTITDLLRRVPGIEVVTQTPYFPAIVGRINWTPENSSHQVLIDGQEAVVESLGFTPWALLSLSLEDVERIEVLRGPASSLFGANALAGVVSITTRSQTQEDLRIFVEAGENASLSAGVAGAGKLQDFHLDGRLGFDLMDRMGVPGRTGKEVFKAHGRAEYSLGSGRRLILDCGGSISHGLLPAVSGDLVTDFYLLNVLSEYKSDDLKARLFWTFSRADGVMDADLVFSGIPLATFTPNVINAHSLDGEFQWTLPIGWEPLLVMIGGGSRSTWMSSPILLNAETFADINHPDYHQPGLDYWELRAGAFVHAELSPADWVTITAGARLDFNTETEEAFSPRLAAVFQPAESQFVRLSAGYSFRKPNSWETLLHPNVTFPENGVFMGPAQDRFREFLSRMVGNLDLGNETLMALEVGYLGQFMDQRLVVGLDLYYNIYSDVISFVTNMVPHDQWMIDLDASSMQFENGSAVEIIGSELSLRYKPSRNISLLATWTHREVLRDGSSRHELQSPKNMITVGGSYNSSWGGLGSLYIHTRSEFPDEYVPNPAGLLESQLTKDMPNAALVLARLGYRINLGAEREMEVGVRLHLPLSWEDGISVGYYEKGGGETPFGRHYGGDFLVRVITAYWKGTF